MSHLHLPFGPYDDDERPVPTVPVDNLEHTDERPFCCANPSCPCHEDETLIDNVHGQVQGGLLTSAEATRIVKGTNI